VRSLLTTLAFLLPFQGLKKRLLNLLGHDIHPGALIGITLVRNVGRFELAEGAVIGHFNVIGGLARVSLEYGARINPFNMIMSGYSGEAEYAHPELKASLIMRPHSRIISWHQFDCSGGVVLGEDAWVTGMRSTLLSHAFDPYEGGFILEPIHLERRAVLGTNCTVLPGVRVGEGSLLAAGSTAWTRQQLDAHSLYGGVKAVRLGPIEQDDYLFDYRRYGAKKPIDG
jgi:acetyltransferase-like isoleucine patch superfamily enzyme